MWRPSTPMARVSGRMQQLIQWTNEVIAEKRLHPLLTIAILLLNFWQYILFRMTTDAYPGLPYSQ